MNVFANSLNYSGVFHLGRVLGYCMIAAVIGCGGAPDERVEVYPVSGKVLVNNQPAAGATVAFYPQSAELQGPKMPLPSGTVDESGDFQLRSYEDGDGAPAGEYKVTIVWPAPPPANATVFDTPDRLRGRYATPEASGLTATIPESDTVLEPFQLK